MELAISETKLQDAMTIEFAHELFDLAVECAERGVSELDIARFLLRWITMQITGEDSFSEAELNGFVAAHQSEVDCIVANFNKEATDVCDLAQALYLTDHAVVGEA